MYKHRDNESKLGHRPLMEIKSIIQPALDAHPTVCSTFKSSEKELTIGFVYVQALKSQLELIEICPEGTEKT